MDYPTARRLFITQFGNSLLALSSSASWTAIVRGSSLTARHLQQKDARGSWSLSVLAECKERFMTLRLRYSWSTRLEGRDGPYC